MKKLFKTINLCIFLSLGLLISLIMLFFMGRVTFLESILVWVLSISITLLIIRNDLAFIFKLEKNLSKKIKVLEKGELPSQVFNNFLNTNIFNNLGNKFSTFEEKYQSKLSEFIKEINQNSVLIDSLPVAIISFSKNYNILKANKIALDVLGKDIINFDIRHIFRHPEVSETIENVLENKSKNRNITIEVFGLPLQIWSLQVLVFSDLNKEYDKINLFRVMNLLV